MQVFKDVFSNAVVEVCYVHGDVFRESSFSKSSSVLEYGRESLKWRQFLSNVSKAREMDVVIRFFGRSHAL